MGNCFRKKKGADNDKSDPSRARASIADSTATTCSTPLTLAVPYSSQGSAGDCVPTPRTEGEILSYPSLKNFAFHELRVATRNFRPDSLIGEGGFGCVFKGRIDEKTLTAAKPGSGTVVAVKKLKPEGIQGDKEWMTEINYLGRLQHPNLVKLIGFSSEDDNRLLVYEFMPKGSLDNHLFRRGPVPLPWATRIKVAVGAAKGLAFLHDAKSQIIYRDVKAANILLDSDFNAKLSDFGLARAGPTGEMTHVSTRIVGSQGYAAPEYIIAGHLSARADVYSFGVVLLEILSGQRAFTEYKSRSKQFLVDWAKPYLRDNRNLSRIMDSKLEGRYSKKEAHAVADLALRCVSIEARRRPPMSVVLATLEQI